MAAGAAPREEKSAAIFLSYSRRDAVFCTRLANALDAAGYTAVYDQSDRPIDDPDLRLTGQDKWWTAITSMIAACDTMVFIVSPDSAKSPVCGDEIDHAFNLGKRVIAIRYRDIDFNSAPEQLRALNVKIDFRAEGPTPFEVALEALQAELAIDIEWHRRGTRLTRVAGQWTADGRPDGQLLRAGAIAEIDAWATRRPLNAPVPGPLVLEFLEASRRRELADAVDRRRTAGRAFVKPAEQALREGRPYAALRWSAAGILFADDHDLELVPELIPCIRGAVHDLHRHSARAVLWGNEASIEVAAFSPDGTLVLTSAVDGAVHLWDARAARRVRQIRSPDHAANITIFSPDGARIATAGNSPAHAYLWDTATGKRIAEFKKEYMRKINHMCFSADGSKLAVAFHGHLACLFDVASGEEISSFQHRNSVFTVSFSPDGERVVSASHDFTAQVWNSRDGAHIATLGNNYEQFAAFSPDGRRIVTTSYGGPPRLWDASDYHELGELKHAQRARTCLRFSNSGAVVASAYEGNRILLWESATGRLAASLKGHRGPVKSIRFSRDDDRLVTASEDGTARVWATESGKELLCLTGHEAEVHLADFSPCGTQIVTASADATARIWDSSNGRIATLRGHSRWVDAATFSADNQRIVSASGLQGSGHVWDALSGKRLATLRGLDARLGGHAKAWSVAFSPDESGILCACGEEAIIFDSASGHEVVKLVGHDDEVIAAKFGRDGKVVLTASRDRTARLWDAANGAELLCLRGHRDQVLDAAISKDGTTIATCSGATIGGGRDSTARIWDAANGALRAVLRGHKKSVTAVDLSPDGCRLITASHDNTARIWDVASGRQLHCLSGHGEWVHVAQFSPDGTLAVTGAFDKTVRLWDPTTGRELVCLRGHEDWISNAMISLDGTRVFTASGDVTARIWDVLTGLEIARYVAHHGCAQAAFFGFSRDGKRLMTQADDGLISVWDVERTAALAGRPLEILLASLPAGNRTPAEREDLLMGGVPEDLRSALLDRVTSAERESARWREELLRQPAHTNCYVPPARRSRSNRVAKGHTSSR